MLKCVLPTADNMHITETKGHTAAMTKRTTVNLDFILVDEAKRVLETKETTETIHRALKEVVRQERLRRLARRRFDFSEAELDELRQPRTADSQPVAVKSRATA